MTATALAHDYGALRSSMKRMQFFGSEKILTLTLLFLIIICAFLQAYLVFILEINWDEFHYLSFVYEFQRGEINRALQTIHVHLFAPLLLLEGDEISQVEAGRVVMLLLQYATFALIYKISRRFFSVPIALFSVLCYAASANTLLHGASFRTDPLAVFFIMSSVLAATTVHWSRVGVCLAATAAAISLMVTVKTVFYLPAFLGVFFLQWNKVTDRADLVKRWLLFALVAVAGFALLYLAHKQSLPASTDQRSASILANAANVTLLKFELFPRAYEIFQHILKSPIQSILWVVGAGFAIASLAKGPCADRQKGIVLLLLSGTIVSLIFYRNAFSYFFPFIMPPFVLLSAYGLQRLKLSLLPTLILAVAMTGGTIVHWNRARVVDQAIQQELVNNVHSTFVEPVAVIDRNGMISSFPRRGFFMSSWGLQNYQSRGQSVFQDVLDESVVPALILNSPTLEAAVGAPVTAPLFAPLAQEDSLLLRESYIPHSDKLWVAGKRLKTSYVASQFVLHVPGRYRIEANQPVLVDENVAVPGDVLTLERGTHSIASSTSQTVILRYADAMPVKSGIPANVPVYRGF